MTTKEQEFKALARIKKIVADLGEGSYIAAAFEGCFEIAEDNIRNDFACSMKQKAELNLAAFQDVSEKYERLQKEQSATQKALDEAREKLKQQKSKALTDEQTRQMIICLNREIEKLNDKTDFEASEIIRLADNPGSSEFAKAVANHRAASEMASEYVKLVQRLRETA